MHLFLEVKRKYSIICHNGQFFHRMHWKGRRISRGVFEWYPFQILSSFFFCKKILESCGDIQTDFVLPEFCDRGSSKVWCVNNEKFPTVSHFYHYAQPLIAWWAHPLNLDPFILRCNNIWSVGINFKSSKWLRWHSCFQVTLGTFPCIQIFLKFHDSRIIAKIIKVTYQIMNANLRNFLFHLSCLPSPVSKLC